MLWVTESVCCLQSCAYMCSASVSRTVTMALFCKDNIYLHLKIKILVRKAFTAMPQVSLASELCLICPPYIAHELNNNFYQKNPHLFWHLMSKKQLLKTHYLSCHWHKLLSKHLILSMLDKIIQQLIFLAVNVETYHTSSFKANQSSTKMDPPHFALHSQA